MLTVEVLLRLDGGAPRNALDAPLAEVAKEIERVLDGAQLRVASSLIHHRGDAATAGDPLAGFDELVRIGGLPPAYARVPLDAFDAVLEIRMPDGSDPAVVITALDGLVERLGNAVDPRQSCVVMGTEHMIVDGDGPVQLFYCFRRIPSVSHDEFLQYWRNKLIEQTTKTPCKTGYRQLHADLSLSSLAAKAVGVATDDFDGVALEWYPDMDGLMTAVSWASEPTAAIIQSESNINDFKSALAMLAYVS